MAALLGSFGVVDEQTHDTIEQVVAEELQAAGFGDTVQFISIRHGRLTLQCDPQTAALLNFDRDRLLHNIRERATDAVNRLAVRTTSRR